jgi:hypothetical protein
MFSYIKKQNTIFFVVYIYIYVTHKMAHEVTTQFSKIFHKVLAGTSVIEEFAQNLMSAAVRDLIETLCEDYGMDVDEVCDKYEQVFVNKYASFSGEVVLPKFCAGTTRQGKPCGRPASYGKFCKTHMDTDNEQKRTQRSLQAYQERLTKMPKPPMPMGSQPNVLTQLDEGRTY